MDLKDAIEEWCAGFVGVFGKVFVLGFTNCGLKAMRVCDSSLCIWSVG